MLEEIHDLAHRIDTSDLSASKLHGWIKDFIGLDRSRLTLLFQSFGFKHGVPLDADMVFDVRCLPNPYYEAQLRLLTGKDEAVIEFLSRDGNVNRMFSDIKRFVDDWLPCFIGDNRNYLTVAIGCTGGRHRSVYFAERLAQYFILQNQVLVRHRDLGV